MTFLIVVFLGIIVAFVAFAFFAIWLMAMFAVLVLRLVGAILAAGFRSR
jgi:hypothetical protein